MPRKDTIVRIYWPDTNKTSVYTLANRDANRMITQISKVRAESGDPRVQIKVEAN